LAAFRAAVAMGFAIELDVRVSRDGVAMVFHDVELDRLCGRAGALAEHDAAQLTSLKLLGTDEHIPTLEQTLGAVAGRVPVLIEVKLSPSQSIERLGRAVVAAIKGYGGALAMQSFDPRIVAWFRRHMPRLPRGQLASDLREMAPTSSAARLALRVMLARRHGRPQFLGYDVRYLPSAMARAARRDGLAVLAWTVRNAADRRRARDHADNIIFERAGEPGH